MGRGPLVFFWGGGGGPIVRIDLLIGDLLELGSLRPVLRLLAF